MKESANYNAKAMTFNAGGIVRTLTLPAVPYDENNGKAMMSRKAMLMGARNIVIDSIAGMTLKAGFSSDQRIEKMAKTMEAIDAGTSVERAPRGESISVNSTQSKLAAVTDVAELVHYRKMIADGFFDGKVSLNADQLAILATHDAKTVTRKPK